MSAEIHTFHRLDLVLHVKVQVKEVESQQKNHKKQHNIPAHVKIHSPGHVAVTSRAALEKISQNSTPNMALQWKIFRDFTLKKFEF